MGFPIPIFVSVIPVQLSQFINRQIPVNIWSLQAALSSQLSSTLMQLLSSFSCVARELRKPHAYKKPSWRRRWYGGISSVVLLNFGYRHAVVKH
jgi:hypothetical protein